MESISDRMRTLQTVFALLPEDFVLEGDDPFNCRQQWQDQDADPFQFDRKLTLAHLRSSASSVLLMPSFEQASDPAFEPSRGAYVLGSRASADRNPPLYRILMASHATEAKIEESWRLAKHIPFVALLSYAPSSGPAIKNRVLINETEIANLAVCVIVGACSDELSIFCVLDEKWWKLMRQTLVESGAA